MDTLIGREEKRSREVINGMVRYLYTILQTVVYRTAAGLDLSLLHETPPRACIGSD